MATKATITVTLEWRREEGSGVRCACCGEPAYLMQERLCLVVDGEDVSSTIEGIGAVLCGSCAEEGERQRQEWFGVTP